MFQITDSMKTLAHSFEAMGFTTEFKETSVRKYGVTYTFMMFRVYDDMDNTVTEIRFNTNGEYLYSYAFADIQRED